MRIEPPPLTAAAEDASPGEATDPDTVRPRVRGVGIVAGVLSLGVAGLADGIVTLVRAPRGSLPAHLGVLVLCHCVAVLLTFGIVLGVLEELALESMRRVPWLVRFATWSVQGPRRWFARDPDAAAAVSMAAVAVAVMLGPTYPIAFHVIRGFHSKPLAALAILVEQVAFIGLGVALALGLAAPLRSLLRRAGPLASPGAVITLGAALAAVQTGRFLSLNWRSFHALDFGVAILAGALLAGNVAALLVLGAGVRRRGRPLPVRAPLAASVVALAAFVLSAFTFGARQTVAATIFNRSVLTQRVARSLQAALDADRDGFSPVFNGGDCNDRNPGINPRAHDLPGNGIDENCSGRDARVEVEESDGHLAPLPAGFDTARPCFVFLSIDAMRPDHMGAYGYRRPTTPNIDRWAQGAARFTRAYTASPRSLRSFASIFVGRYASSVAWGDDVQFPPLEPANETLAEVLRGAGYHTAAMHNTSYFSHTAGFFQGFDAVHEEVGFKEDSGPTAARIVEYLRGRAGDPTPFFLWSHLMDAHDPYRDHNSPRDFGTSEVDRYDEELAHADAALAPVFEALRELSAQRPVYTFVFADHGEAFGEHGVYHHSFDLHEEAIRVPILVAGPGIQAGARNRLASLLDLHPTLLNLSGLRPAAAVSGWSLVPALFDPAPGTATPRGWRDHLYAEVTPDGVFPSESKVILAPPWKLLWDIRNGVWELFHTDRDPGERDNLFDGRGDIVPALRERLLTWTEHGALQTNRSAALITAARLPAVPTMQHTLNVRFGDIVELLGYDLVQDRLRINDTFRAVFYYRVLRRTRVRTMPTVSFDPTDGQPIWAMFLARHHPVYGRYPTTEWNPGEILRDEVTLRVDPEMRPVRLRAYFSLEIERTNERIQPLSADAQDGRIELAPIEIVPAE